MFGDKFCEVIYCERIIELMFEGYMLYDYCCWLIVLKEWSGMENGMIGLNFYGIINEEYYKNVCLDV